MPPLSSPQSLRCKACAHHLENAGGGLARHFSELHGYELMGVGASYIGFIRAEPPDISLADRVAKDFCALYNTGDESLPAQVRVATEAISGRRHLWLRYVE